MMEDYVAFLRGVNVSGSNLIRMEKLRIALTTDGFLNVASYIQSGNLVFKMDYSKASEIQDRIKHLIHREFGISVPVMVLPLSELQQAADSNPFLNLGGIFEEYLHLTILQENFTIEENSESYLSLEEGSEKAKISGRFIYLFLPSGYGNARLTNAYFEKKFKIPATTRNWKTIKKMLSLTADRQK